MRTHTSRLASTTTWIIIGASGVVLLLLAITILFQRTTDCGTDKACFTRQALSCKNARLLVIDDRGAADLVTKGCVVTKTITVLDNAVPELEEEIVGQSMRCPYENGHFPLGLLESITSGTDICDGELVDKLRVLASFSE